MMDGIGAGEEYRETSAYVDPADRNLTLAERYLEIGQPRRTLESLERLAGAQAEDPYVWFLRGQALYDLEQYQEAGTAASAGLKLEPEYVPLLYLRCNCEWKLGNLAEAERAILAALRLMPEQPNLLCRYALLVANAGQFEKARRLLDEAARISPNDPGVIRARVALSYVSGDDRKVGEHSRELLMEEPEDVYGHQMLGVAMASRGRMGNAARELGRAVSLDPTSRHLGEAARELRLVTHPLLWPLWPFHRFGPARIWLGAIAILYGLRALGLYGPALIFGLCYFLLCVYSWVVPFLLRRWLRWRHG